MNKMTPKIVVWKRLERAILAQAVDTEETIGGREWRQNASVAKPRN